MLVKGFLLTNYPESLSMHTDHSIVHKQLKTKNSMEVKETETSSQAINQIDRELRIRVEKRITFDISGVGQQKESCYNLMKNLVEEEQVSKKDLNTIMRFPCDEYATGIRQTTYFCKEYTNDLISQRPPRGQRFTNLRDAAFFAQFLRKVNTRELEDSIFMFWNSRMKIKNSDQILKENIICVSIEKTDSQEKIRPMVYACPVDELFNGELKDTPKFLVFAEIAYYS